MILTIVAVIAGSSAALLVMFVNGPPNTELSGMRWWVRWGRDAALVVNGFFICLNLLVLLGVIK